MSTSPAGWQPDPRGRHEYRYWDGSKWTDHVSDKGVVASDPVADETPAAAAGAPATAVQPAVQADPTPEPEAAAEPAVTPEPSATPDPSPAQAGATPIATATPTGGGSAPPPGGSTSSSSSSAGASASAAAETAKAQAKEAFESKSPDLGVLLSVIAPGTGHAYLGKNQAGPVPWFALTAATVVAAILAYLSFPLFIVGFVIWVAAAAFAVNDLQGDAKAALENASIPQQFVGILLTAAGVIMIIALFLPFYHYKVSGGGFSASGSVSGWTALSIIDIILFVVALISIAGGLLAMGIIGRENLPAQVPQVIAGAGVLALVLVVFREFIDSAPGSGDGVKIGRAPGILLAADAAIIMVMANLSTLRSIRK